LPKVGQNGTDIRLKLKVKLGKVMKWFAILTILSFCYVCGEKIGSLAYLGRKILNVLMLVWKIFLTSPRGQHFRDLVKILGNVGQNMTTPPPPPPPPPPPMLMASRRP
jgi:hypothetical protein